MKLHSKFRNYLQLLVLIFPRVFFFVFFLLPFRSDSTATLHLTVHLHCLPSEVPATAPVFFFFFYLCVFSHTSARVAAELSEKQKAVLSDAAKDELPRTQVPSEKPASAAEANSAVVKGTLLQ